MTLAKILMYFATCAGFLFVSLELFAFVLRKIVNVRRLLRLIIGVPAYCLIGISFWIPLYFMDKIYRLDGGISDVDKIVAVGGYLLTLLFVVLSFRYRHFNTLRKLGYFRSRS